MEGIDSHIGRGYGKTGQGGQGLIPIPPVQTRVQPWGSPLPHTSCSTLSQPMEIYAPTSIYLCQLGYKGDPPGEGSGMHKGLTILCRMKWPAEKVPAMPSSRKYSRAQGGDWVLPGIPRWRSLLGIGPPRGRRCPSCCHSCCHYWDGRHYWHPWGIPSPGSSI